MTEKKTTKKRATPMSVASGCVEQLKRLRTEESREEAMAHIGIALGRCDSVNVERKDGKTEPRRRAAQILVEEIGASGPETIEETALRAATALRERALARDRFLQLVSEVLETEDAPDALWRDRAARARGIYD